MSNTNNLGNRLVVVGSETHRAEIKETGKTVDVGNLYHKKVCYRYNCILSTTLGPEIAGANTFPWAISLASSLFNMQTRLWFLSIIGLIIIPSLFAAGVSQSVRTALFFVFMVLQTGTTLIDIFYAVAVDIPTTFAWSRCFVFRRPDMNSRSSNNFITIAVQNIRQYIATDMHSTLLRVAQGARMELNIMLYSQTWEQKYIWGYSLWPSICSLLFYIFFLGYGLREGSTGFIILAVVVCLIVAGILAKWVLICVFGCAFLFFDFMVCGILSQTIARMEKVMVDKILDAENRTRASKISTGA